VIIVSSTFRAASIVPTPFEQSPAATPPKIQWNPRLCVAGSTALLEFQNSSNTEVSLEQFVRQQNIAIFRRLLNTQADNNEARRQRLLTLLADEEAKEAASREPEGRR